MLSRLKRGSALQAIGWSYIALLSLTGDGRIRVYGRLICCANRPCLASACMGAPNGILVSHRGPLTQEVWQAWESSGGGRLPVAASDRDLEPHSKKVKGLAERRQNRLSRPTGPYASFQAVLRAAAATFRDMGYQAAKLGDVADRAGLIGALSTITSPPRRTSSSS